ncbi:PhdYeFM domain-containing protein [Rhizohabitans arisaemae]|uniref:PhdYeFM domain-containing protein n=1 Tax=Rhizohabitans arisaemae TaxID=2720610 RepID=UPI0024B225C9|nr:PhdYeFM domain-containing protein [Rhizohabitans arisaemae]
MAAITEQEFFGNLESILDSVESGETYQITRNGIGIAELRPLPRRPRLTAEELVARHRRLPNADPEELRREPDGHLGTAGPFDN